MKYSLRSPTLDAVLAVPFLLFGGFAVCCIWEVSHRYEEMLIIDGLSYDLWSQEDPYDPPNSSP